MCIWDQKRIMKHEETRKFLHRISQECVRICRAKTIETKIYYKEYKCAKISK